MMPTKPQVRPVTVLVNGDGSKAQIRFASADVTKMLPIHVYNAEMLRAIEDAGPNATIPCEAAAAPTPSTVTPERNPYNFAEWEGDSPSLPPEPHKPSAQHDRWWPERLSGSISVRLAACSPIFVTQGALLKRDDRTLRSFWSCLDKNGKRRFAIPGSSVKGVARMLVETLTNSALSIVDNSAYAKPIAYRRRSAVLWVITANSADGGLTLALCEAVFARQLPAGNSAVKWDIRPAKKGEPPKEIPTGAIEAVAKNSIDPDQKDLWQPIELRANLLWTPDYCRVPGAPPQGRHAWTHLLVRVTGESASAPADLVERYMRYVDHSAAIDNHLERVDEIGPDGPGRNYYSSTDDERAAIELRKRDLKRLCRGDYVFGILVATQAEPVKLACFGKNVNFMWPDGNSPEDLAGAFFPKDEKTLTLAGADVAQAIFGFAGSYRDKGHPFRGRVRFGTFWAQGEPVQLAEIQLRPLTAPTGVRLKARSLYLPPDSSGKMQTYTEAKSLRGRKYYWHQRSADDLVHTEHKVTTPAELEKLEKAPLQFPPLIVPLARDTIFEGVVQFDNLTRIELGCLLVALCPDLVFGAGKYGWKIGKAKPRGLGSVHPTLALMLRNNPTKGFASPFEQPLRGASPKELDDLVQAFIAWLDLTAVRLHGNNSSRRDLTFFQDLERLLRLPEVPVLRQYSSIETIAGPMPQFESATGVPKTAQRSAVMKRARNIP